jgi:hypothetical protein
VLVLASSTPTKLSAIILIVVESITIARPIAAYKIIFLAFSTLLGSPPFQIKLIPAKIMKRTANDPAIVVPQLVKVAIKSENCGGNSTTFAKTNNGKHNDKIAVNNNDFLSVLFIL